MAENKEQMFCSKCGKLNFSCNGGVCECPNPDFSCEQWTDYFKLKEENRKKKLMTKEEAYIAMKAGNKITHMYFSPDEYLYIKHGVMYSEEGYNFEKGWKDRSEECFKNDWRIYNGN